MGNEVRGWRSAVLGDYWREPNNSHQKAAVCFAMIPNLYSGNGLRVKTQRVKKLPKTSQKKAIFREDLRRYPEIL